MIDKDHDNIELLNIDGELDIFEPLPLGDKDQISYMIRSSWDTTSFLWNNNLSDIFEMRILLKNYVPGCPTQKTLLINCTESYFFQFSCLLLQQYVQCVVDQYL